MTFAAPGKLTLTIQVGRIDPQIDDLINATLAADIAVYGHPDLTVEDDTEDVLLTLWKWLSLLMSKLSDQIALRQSAADQAGMSDTQLSDLQYAIGAYEATEKIRTILIGTLLSLAPDNVDQNQSKTAESELPKWPVKP